MSGILISEIVHWLDIMGIDDIEERQDYLFFLQQMDKEYLNFYYKAVESERKK